MCRNYESAVSLFAEEKSNSADMIIINVIRTNFLSNVLILFFEELDWHSKKEKDYKDWKVILQLKEKGLHYTEEGIKIINLILSQMNLKRLSTNKNSSSVDRDRLYLEINRLLSGPSNLEIKEDGIIFIKSLNRYYSDHTKIAIKLKDENGLVLKSFESLTDCAETLGFSRYKVRNLYRKREPFLLDGKKVHLRSDTSLDKEWLSMGTILVQILFNC